MRTPPPRSASAHRLGGAQVFASHLSAAARRRSSCSSVASDTLPTPESRFSSALTCACVSRARRASSRARCAFSSRRSRFCSRRVERRRPRARPPPASGGGGASVARSRPARRRRRRRARRGRRRRRARRVGRDGRDDGEERHLLVGARGSASRSVALAARASSRAQRVAALLGDAGGVAAQPRVVGDEEPRALPRHAARPADEAADGLAEEQLGGGRRGVDADAQARDVDALGDHAHGDEPRVARRGERGDLGRRLRVVGGDEPRRRAEARAEQRGDAARVLLVGGDHEAAGVRLLARAPR